MWKCKKCNSEFDTRPIEHGTYHFNFFDLSKRKFVPCDGEVVLCQK